MRDYLTTTDVLGIHAVLLQRYGGATGVRDMDGLEAAVFRPQSGYYQNIEEEACALLESLLVNHPFVDGNKRTAFAAFEVFLHINGHSVTADDTTLYAAILKWLALPSQERFASMVKDIEKMISTVSE